MNIKNNEMSFNKSKTNKIDLQELEQILEDHYFNKT